MKWRHILACCHNNLSQRKPINSPAACFLPAMLSSKFQSIQGVGSAGGGTCEHPWIVNRIKRPIMTMLLMLSMPSFLYTMLWFIYFTFIHISFSQSLNFWYLSLTDILTHDKEALHISSSSSFQHRKKQAIYPQGRSWWRSQHDIRHLQ
jgi:hypothetical protein